MRIASYEKIGHKFSGIESLEEISKTIYPEILIESPIAPYMSGEVGEIIPDKKAIYAVNNDSVQYISTVGSGYGLVQPYDSVKDMQSHLDKHELKITHGGKLNGGKKMFFLADVYNAETEIVKGDVVKLSLLRSGSFDGSSTDRYDGIITRLVCMNGAKLDEIAFSLSFKHTARIHQKLDKARNQIQLAIQAFLKTTEKMRKLAQTKVSDQQIEAYVRNVLLSDETEEVSTRMENNIRHVIELAHNGTGLDLLPNIRGTAWAAYNAVTEYTSHDYGKDDDSRLLSSWFGASHKLNNKAMQLAMTM